MFTKNRDRLRTTDMSRKVMAAIPAHPEVKPLLSDERFSVDGPLVKAFAMGLEPKATPWLTLHEALSAEGQPAATDPGASPAGTDQLPRQTETQPMPDTPRQPRTAEVDVRGEKRSNATHASVTDPDARLCKKAPGAAATLCFLGHMLMESRNGPVVQAELTHAPSWQIASQSPAGQWTATASARRRLRRSIATPRARPVA